MKISEILNETTSSGSVATVSQPMNGSGPLKRVGKGIYNNTTKPGDNLLTGKKTNKKFANSIAESKDVPLKFHTIELEPKYFRNFVVEWVNANNIEPGFTGSHVSNLRTIEDERKIKLSETKEFDEIQPFIEAINRVDSKKTIKVGDTFTVLSFHIMYFHREIEVTGHTTPAKVTKISLHKDGTIAYLAFDNGEQYPRCNKVTIKKGPIEQAAYFDTEQEAEHALSMLRLILPDGWELNTSGLNIPTDREGLNESATFNRMYRITDDEKYHSIVNRELT